MEELVEEIKQLKLELYELKEKVNQLLSTRDEENRYKKWLPEEEFQLIKELQNELKIYEIAKNHGRSNSAIKSRIKKIVLEKFSTQSLEFISSVLKLDIAFIKKIIN